MNQALFDWTTPVAAPRGSEQDRQLARVEGRIAETILSVLHLWSRAGVQDFRLAELTEAVVAEQGGAPDSVSRVLRALRRSGQVAYVVINRAASLYRLEGVR